MRARHGDARGRRLMRDLSKDRALLAINSATVKPWTLRAAGRGLRARRHHGDRAVARHRAGRRRREGRQADPRRGPDRDRASAAAACFPPPTRPAAAPRSTTTAAPSTRPRHRRALPGADRGRPAERLEGPRRRARAGARRASRRCCPMRAPPACRSRSSRCIRCTPPTAPA